MPVSFSLTSLGFIDLVSEVPEALLWKHFVELGTDNVSDEVYFENLRMKVYFLERMVSEGVNLKQIGSISRETVKGWLRSQARPINRYVDA